MGRHSKHCNLKVKSVGFNTLDPYEQQLFQYANSFTNFSRTMKRWIAQSMNGNGEVITPAASISLDEPELEAGTEEDLIGEWMSE